MAGPKKVDGVITRNGKPLWKNDENREPYSEKTASYEYGTGYIVTPTIDPETGGNYKLDDLFEHYEKNGPYDMFTGEKLPVFDDEATATEYSKWRSSNLLNEDLTDQEFYTGESDAYYKQDGSDVSLMDYLGDAKAHAGDIKGEVMGFFSNDSPEVEDIKMALGGIPTATKGITTLEGREMANKKFQRDDADADTDGDGELSTREKEIANATQRGGLLEMSHGGMACGCGGDCDGSCIDMMGGIMGYDEVSGNPIPVGSNADNVRDDIDAKLSTDEYVLPAHVVKWHGLKHIMDMQSEAEMGLMGMQIDGLIQHAGSPETEYEEVEEPEEDDLSEEMDIEIATVEVDDLLDEEEESEELTPKTSKLPGMLKKQKYAFST